MADPRQKRLLLRNVIIWVLVIAGIFLYSGINNSVRSVAVLFICCLFFGATTLAYYQGNDLLNEYGIKTLKDIGYLGFALHPFKWRFYNDKYLLFIIGWTGLSMMVLGFSTLVLLNYPSLAYSFLGFGVLLTVISLLTYKNQNK